MKYILAFITTAIILFISTYFLLGIWDIDLMSKENFNKTLISVAIILITTFVLTVFIIIPVFKSLNTRGYKTTNTGIAEKKNNIFNKI